MTTNAPDIYALLLEAVGRLDDNDSDLGVEVFSASGEDTWTASVVDLAGSHVVQHASADGTTGTAAVKALAERLRNDLRERSAECEQLAKALSRGCGREIEIAAPFVRLGKHAIVVGAGLLGGHTAALEDIARSWSCYRGDGPCGACSPCVLRRATLADAGIADLSARAPMAGGDGAWPQGRT